VLLQLLQRDLRLGHHRVALRHFLMTQACGVHLPVSLRLECEKLLLACPVSQRTRIERDVDCWAGMIGVRRLEGSATPGK
jgi:hypothetical protein